MQERSAGFVVAFIDAEAPIQYLVLDYGRHWDLPKGHVEPGETDLVAARRELLEETGVIEIDVVPNFEKSLTYYFRKSGRLVKKTVIFFLAKARPAPIVLSVEHAGYALLPFEQACRRLTFASARQLLRAADARLTECHAPTA